MKWLNCTLQANAAPRMRRVRLSALVCCCLCMMYAGTCSIPLRPAHSLSLCPRHQNKSHSCMNLLSHCLMHVWKQTCRESLLIFLEAAHHKRAKQRFHSTDELCMKCYLVEQYFLFLPCCFCWSWLLSACAWWGRTETRKHINWSLVWRQNVSSVTENTDNRVSAFHISVLSFWEQARHVYLIW